MNTNLQYGFERWQRSLRGVAFAILFAQTIGAFGQAPPREFESAGPKRAPAGTIATMPIAPMSIGPAPGLYPPFPTTFRYGQPVIGFDGRPVYAVAPVYLAEPVSVGRPANVGRPVYGPPIAYGPPVVYGPPVMAELANPRLLPPPQPVPFTANSAPSRSDAASSVPVATRRPDAPANLRLTVSEAFLNRVIPQPRVEPGPVNDYIFGAQITGHQTTVSRVHVDFKPAADKAVVAVVLNGDVQTMTTGVTPQAMIDTAGQQQFQAVKEIYFDGLRFSTRHATVFARARNQTVGATTPLTGTLFGGIADRIAYAAAERRKSAGEAVARDRLVERLFPAFDGELDERLSQANRQLEPLRKRLDSVRLLPTSQAVWTTDTHLWHAMLIGDAHGIAETVPAFEAPDAAVGVRLLIHETLLNTLVDRAGMKGLKTTDKKLRELQDWLLATAAAYSADGANQLDDATELDDGARLNGANESLKPPLPSVTETFVTDIEFDDVEPLTMRLERDRLLVTIKARFKPAGQEIVPPMTVTIPYKTELVGNKIRWVAGQPRVVAQDRTDASAPQTIFESMIERVIEADLIPLEFDRVLPASLWKGNGPAPRIASVKSDHGWVTIVIE